MEEMKKSHQLFLQMLINKGHMTKTDVKESYILARERFPEQEPEDDNIMNQILGFVGTINKAIAPYDLEIKKGIQEHDCSSVYCLVNTVESPITRLSSTYTANELELFKKVVECIVESDEGKIGSRNALNLTEKLQKRMGLEEAQNFFDSLEREKWIIKGNDGTLALSIRTILELDQYLQDLYPDLVKKCNLCKKICLMGESCVNCGIKIHRMCSRKLFNEMPEKKCPSCKNRWSEAYS